MGFERCGIFADTYFCIFFRSRALRGAAIHVKKFGLVRWDTLLVGIEVLVTFMLGLLPETAPYQITQVAVNFICSMQYNTFRQAEGTPMSTTFCTNILRQVGINFVKWLRKGKSDSLGRSVKHLCMLGTFVLLV